MSYGPAVMVSWAIKRGPQSPGELGKGGKGNTSRRRTEEGPGEPGCLQWRQAGPPAGLEPGVGGHRDGGQLETPGSEQGWGRCLTKSRPHSEDG